MDRVPSGELRTALRADGMVSQEVPSWNQLRECLLGLNAVLEAENGARGEALERGSKGLEARESPSPKVMEPSANSGRSARKRGARRSATG